MPQASRSLLFFSFATAVAYPAMAAAQTAAEASPATENPSAAANANADTAEAAAPEAQSYGDIVVSAQRRDQRLTDVPISVTAATGADLVRSGIVTTRDLQLVTPALTLQSTGPWLQPSIRGVGSSGTIPGSEQNIALYVDGVYQPQAASNAFDLPDVERVEVLKGPQGTLFGRNATGGAIQIITRTPSLTDTSGLFSGSYGRFNDWQLKGFISTPLIADQLALSLSAAHGATDGWNRNLLTDKRFGKIRSDIVRGKLLWQPGETIKFLLTGFYARRFDDSVSGSSLYNGNGTATGLGVTPIPAKPFQVAPNFRSDILNNNYGGSLKADLETDVGTFTSTTAYLKNKFHLQTDGDASPALILQYDFQQPTTSYSEELLFNSKQFGGLSFIAGVYAFHLKSGYTPGLFIYAGQACSAANPSCLFLNEQWKTSATSFAGFTDATYEISDKISLIGGLRFTYEKRKILDNYDIAPARDSRSKRNVIPRASIQYKFDPSANIYFTYSQGFKSGLWNSDGLPDNIPGGRPPNYVDPEKVSSYEVGIKASRRMFTFSAAAFYLDYKNLQNQTLNPQTGAGELGNAGGEHIWGGEIALNMRATPELSFVAQAAYTHAKYTDYPDAPFTVPISSLGACPSPPFVPGAAQCGNATIFVDLSGTTPARSPRLTGNLGVNYEKELTSGTLGLSAAAYYSSSFSIFNGTAITQPKYVQLGANLWWTFSDTGLKVGLYGKNLTNRTVFLASSLLPTGDLVSYQERRNYGVNVQYSF